MCTFYNIRHSDKLQYTLSRGMRVIILLIWCAAAMNLDFLNDMVSKIETKADSVKLLNNNRHNKMDQARQLVQGLRGRRRTRRKNRMQMICHGRVQDKPED